MIELRTLGDIDLRRSDGGPLRSVLTKPKRLALLVRLAAAPPGSFHRRGTLMTLFWPEGDEARARNALSQALYVLRTELGRDDVIVARGDEVGVDPGRLRCDAASFGAALDRGDPAAALDEYRGEFLPGFWLAGCPGFEAWVEDERARLRALALAGARQLADADDDAGDPLAAARWLRRATEWHPYEEPLVRELMGRLAEGGDRAGALAEYDRFVDRLGRDLEVEPGPATTALAARLRDPSPAAPADPPTTGASVPSAPPTPPVARAPTPAGRRRPGTRLAVVVACGTLVALLGIGAYAETAHRGSDPFERALAVSTESPAARAAYREAEDEFRAGRFVAAIARYRRAIAEDSTFALAYYRLSMATLWADQPEANTFALDALAERHSHRLPERERQLIQAYLAWRSGQAERAERLYRGLRAEDPADTEALHMLGETLFHYNPVRGRSVAESRAVFEAVIRTDPMHVEALWHLAQLAAMESRTDELDRLLDRMAAFEVGPGRALEMRALRTFGRGDAATEAGFLTELAGANVLHITAVVRRLAVQLGDLDAARRAARLLVVESRPLYSRAVGHSTLAHLEIAAGRREDAAAEIRALRALDHCDQQRTLEEEVFLAVLPPVPAVRSRIESLRDEVAHWDGGRYCEHGRFETNGALRAYLLGLLDSALGDTAAVRRHARTLERDSVDAANRFAATLRALIEVHGSRPDRALALLAQPRLDTWFGWALTSAVLARSYERFLRAELLRELGRDHEAIGWYRSFTEHGVPDLVYRRAAERRLVDMTRPLDDG